MSKAEYKRLGDYIRPIDVRNRDLKIHLSQGDGAEAEQKCGCLGTLESLSYALVDDYHPLGNR